MANDVQITQQLLTNLGNNLGPIDGSYGGKTKRALDQFYASQDKVFDGELSSNEIDALKTARAALVQESPPMLTLVGQTILSKSLLVFFSVISIGLPPVLGSANASLTILSISGFVTPSPDSFLGIPSDALRSST